MSNQKKRAKALKGERARRQFGHDVADDLHSVLDSQLSKPARKYYESLVDPRGGPKAKVPTLNGGRPGKTAPVQLKAEFTLEVGTNFGFLQVGPGQGSTDGGPYSDRIAGCYSDSSFAELTTTPPSAWTSATTGLNTFNWVAAPYVAASARQFNVQYRVVSCGIYIKPASKRLDQESSYWMYETPGHVLYEGSAGSIRSQKRARKISGLDYSKEHCLNWHPSSMGLDQTLSGITNTRTTDDFTFLAATVGNTSALPTGLIVYFDGTAGLKYDVEVYVNYELRGGQVRGRTVSPVDPIGMAMVLNALDTKALSGWSGSKHQAILGYAHRLVEANKHLLPEEAKTIWERVKSSDILSDIASVASNIMGALF